MVGWAVGLHRAGTAWGDDFALYLRQAKGLVNGNVGQVIADNHFNVDNAAKPGFSPYVYPWGFPLLLAPFYRWFGLDYARLRLVEVACFVAFLWFFFAVVRRRSNRWLALATVAALGTTLTYLQHTDRLLSELPYMALVAITLWWLDRLRRGQPLDSATRSQLVMLGLLTMFVFNTRREGLAIVAAVAVAQLFDLRGRWRAFDWRQVATPYLAFFGSVALSQLMLPSTLVPEYEGSGLGQTWKKLQGPFRDAFARQLGFESLAGFGLLVVFLVVIVGLIVRMWRAGSTDAPLAVFAVGSMLIAGMIPAISERYLLAVTPFALYFAAQAIASIPLPRNSATWLAAGVLAVVTAAHVTELPSSVHDARQYRSAGANAGPETPEAQAGFDAVRTYTHQDDVVSFFKVRALTLYTDRRGVQSDVLQVVRERSDYFLMMKDRKQGQALVSDLQAAAMDWFAVWQDDSWVLWRLPLYESP